MSETTYVEVVGRALHGDNYSPCDSLSPLDDAYAKVNARYANESSYDGGDSANVSHKLQSEQALNELNVTSLRAPLRNDVATTFESTREACSPRSTIIVRDHRPSNLKLWRTNGFTAVPLQDLKQSILDARPNDNAAITQVARPRLRTWPPTPDTATVMGNKASTLANPSTPDNASERSVVRNPVRVLRKSSTNFFRRYDSRLPLPRENTGAALEVQQQASQTTFDGSNDGKDENDSDPFTDSAYVSDSHERPLSSASPVTITNSNAFRPLSASTMIRRSASGDDWRAARSPQKGQRTDPSRLSPLKIPPRHSALSPTIAAPSPLPEYSPHGYGLKDRTDTPDMPEPEDISVVKARRKSTGLDIFNEAKSLQSASSFLNGLSTSRRRAESTQRSTDASGWTLTESTRPSSSRLPSRPSSGLQHTYSSERCRGHHFKPSGFAYTRPLTMAQMKCYRNHDRLLPSRNKKAPVECSVCHTDDDEDHFSCGWCALRLCRFCKKDFGERGMTALRDRIRQAELGTDSPSGSTENLGFKSRKKNYV